MTHTVMTKLDEISKLSPRASFYIVETNGQSDNQFYHSLIQTLMILHSVIKEVSNNLSLTCVCVCVCVCVLPWHPLQVEAGHYSSGPLSVQRDHQGESGPMWATRGPSAAGRPGAVPPQLCGRQDRWDTETDERQSVMKRDDEMDNSELRMRGAMLKMQNLRVLIQKVHFTLHHSCPVTWSSSSCFFWFRSLYLPLFW